MCQPLGLASILSGAAAPLKRPWRPKQDAAGGDLPARRRKTMKNLSNYRRRESPAQAAGRRAAKAAARQERRDANRAAKATRERQLSEYEVLMGLPDAALAERGYARTSIGLVVEAGSVRREAHVRLLAALEDDAPPATGVILQALQRRARAAGESREILQRRAALDAELRQRDAELRREAERLDRIARAMPSKPFPDQGEFARRHGPTGPGRPARLNGWGAAAAALRGE